MSAASVALRQPANRAVGTTHPQYGLYAPVWEKLANCYSGDGGFLDGTYLVAHPREWEDYTATNPKKPTKKLKARRAIARYENVAGTILNQLQAALFRESITRTIGKDEDSTEKHPLSAWWRNVGGKGTCSIDDYMATHWIHCGLYGHIVHLMDLPRATEAPLTQADAGEPFLCAYTPTDVADWRIDDYGAVTAVKLLEVETQPDIKVGATEDRFRVRYVTQDRWDLVSYDGTAGDGGEHGFGRLPVVFQYAKRRALSTVLGQSVLNDPNLYIDLYNLTSEKRELLRNQVFSILNLPLGDGPDKMSVTQLVEILKASGGVGTENVMFSALPAQFISADAGNVTVYQEECAKLLRSIYRLAGVPWEADSRDAEAEGSLKLKRQDMSQILSSYADECEKAEYQFVELWFRHKHGDRWQQELDNAQVVIRYPDTFDVTPFAELLEEAQAAVALDLPPTAMKEIRRRVIAKFLPDVTPSVLEAIGKELDQLAVNEPKQRAAELKAALVKASGGAYGNQPGAQDGAAAV
jgi:hypothetical protein